MKKHISYLDFLRSFAIIMVVALHSITPHITDPSLYASGVWYINLAANAITRTGVPLFLMISGYLMLNSDTTRDFGAFYKKRLLHILVPLIFWNVAYYIYDVVSNDAPLGVVPFVERVLECGTYYHLWYLYTIVGIYLCAPFLKIIADAVTPSQKVLLLVLMLFGTTIRPFINALTPLYIYFFEPLFNGYMACFFMGYVLGSTDFGKKAVAAFSLCGALGFFVSCYYHHTGSSGESVELVFNYGYSLCHYALAAAVFVVAKAICTKECRVWRFVSGLSFGIYLVHVMVMELVTNYLVPDLTPALSSACVFALTFVLSGAIVYVVSKIKYLRNIVV